MKSNIEQQCGVINSRTNSLEHAQNEYTLDIVNQVIGEVKKLHETAKSTPAITPTYSAVTQSRITHTEKEESKPTLIVKSKDSQTTFSELKKIEHEKKKIMVLDTRKKLIKPR